MDSIALILVLIPIGILGLIVFFMGKKVDLLVARSEEVSARRASRVGDSNSIESFLMVQRHWSAKTFGLGAGRWKGIVAHVEKELREIEQDPLDLDEWIDVIILGFDGAWRTGATNHAIIAALFAKQAKNRRRQWIVSEDESVPAEHYKPTPRLSEALWPSPTSPSRPLIEEVADNFDQWKDEVYEPAMATVGPASIDISVYPNKVTGKWVVQVGDDTYRLAQFESEEAAKQYARQTADAMRMQMKQMEERLHPLLIVEPAESPLEDTKIYVVEPPAPSKPNTNLRRLSPEEQQRILSDPKAYEEWRGACGLEKPGTPGEVT